MTRRIIYQQKTQPAQVGDPITLDRWFQPVAQPVRRAILATALVVSGGVLPPQQTAPETITVDKWHQALSLPARAKPALPVAQQVTQARSFVFPVAEVITADKWLVPLAEPPRRPTIHPSLQVATARDMLFPGQEVITLDKWYRAIAEPTRPAASIAKAALGTGTAPFVALPPAPSYGWYAGLNEPPKRPSFHAAFQVTTATSFTFPQPENITLDKWFAPLSQRLYAKPGQPAQLQPFLFRGGLAPLQGDILTSMWLRPLAEPVRPKVALPTGARSDGVGILRILLNPEVVTLDKWFAAMARPVLPYAPRYASYQYVAVCVVPAVTWRHGGLSGSVDGSVKLAGDSGASVRLTGRTTS